MKCCNKFKILAGGAVLSLFLSAAVAAQPHDHLIGDGHPPAIKNWHAGQGMSSEAITRPPHWIAQSKESAKKTEPPDKSGPQKKPGPPNNPGPPNHPGPPKPPGPISPASP